MNVGAWNNWRLCLWNSTCDRVEFLSNQVRTNVNLALPARSGTKQCVCWKQHNTLTNIHRYQSLWNAFYCSAYYSRRKFNSDMWSLQVHHRLWRTFITTVIFEFKKKTRIEQWHSLDFVLMAIISNVTSQYCSLLHLIK